LEDLVSVAGQPVRRQVFSFLSQFDMPGHRAGFLSKLRV
jgi:hypothetical protein